VIPFFFAETLQKPSHISAALEWFVSSHAQNSLADEKYTAFDAPGNGFCHTKLLHSS
jgi:hypothetical protein